MASGRIDRALERNGKVVRRERRRRETNRTGNETDWERPRKGTEKIQEWNTVKRIAWNENVIDMEWKWKLNGGERNSLLQKPV